MAESNRTGRRHLFIALAVGVAVVALDQLTKTVAVNNLRIGEPIPVWWTLEWELVYNRGSAFGLGTGVGPVIGVFALVMAGVLLVAAWLAPKPSYSVVYGLIAGGAIGNVLDRIFRAGDCPGVPCDGFMGGAVIDFIDLNWWPVFNIADMAVVTGVLAIAVGAFLLDRRAAVPVS